MSTRASLPTGFYLHPAAALHDTGWGHPDHQGRLRALASAVGRDMVDLHGRVVQLPSEPASRSDLARVHALPYLDRLRETVARAEREDRVVELEEGIPVSGASWEAATGSAGAVLEALRAVLDGELRNAFVAARPPGHGAGPGGAGGHSLVNHVALAVFRYREREPEGRVLVVDWDVHRPWGTEAALAEDSRSLVFTLDEKEADGDPDPELAVRDAPEGEPGRAAGYGSGGIVRCLVPPGLPRGSYLERFRAGLADAAHRIAPDLVLLSAGFDVLAGDPRGGQLLEPSDMHALARALVEVAEERAGGRLVGVLEGGYDPGRTGQGVVNVLRAFADLPAAGPA